MNGEDAAMRRSRIGDVIEFRTGKGLFYAQYTHEDEMYGELIQAGKTCYDVRPRTLQEILDDEIGIITFLTLNCVIRCPDAEIIGNAEVPPERRLLPVFRVPGQIAKDGAVLHWRFWDGRHTWPEKPIRRLEDGDLDLPIKGIWGKELLVERLESGWTPVMAKEKAL